MGAVAAFERYRYGVSTSTTKIIQAERRSIFARIFTRILCAHSNENVRRFEKNHSAYDFPESAHNAGRSVSLREHLIVRSRNFLFTLKNWEHKMQCPHTSASQPVAGHAAAAPRAITERRPAPNATRIICGGERFPQTKNRKPKGAKPWQFPGTQSGPIVTASSPYLNNCRQRASRRFFPR
jgi:hypothetical protein